MNFVLGGGGGVSVPVLSVPGSQPEPYLVLQVAAVLVRLPDLLLQLLAALVLIGQLLGQQLATLPGLAQVLQGGGGLHLHRLGDVLSRPKQSGSTKRQCVMRLQQVFFFFVPSPLALCPSRGPTPAAAPSPCPLVSSAPPLSSTRSARSVSPGGTADRSAAARTAPAGGFGCAGFRSPAATNHMVSASRLVPVTDVPPVLSPWRLTFMSMVLDCEGMVDSCCRRPWVTLRFCFRLSFSADRHRTRFSESVAP